MKWIEIILEAETDITEEASNVFMEMGASGTQIQNPDEIRSLIEQAGASELADVGDFYNELQNYRITAYFPPSKNFEEMKGALKQIFPGATIIANEVDDSNWKNNWKKHYKSFQLTPKLKVIPSWDTENEPDDSEIVMDPGMAFGTGTHESTSLCASLVENCTRKGDSFLDIGTGTGILSIVAARSGAEDIVALDIDETAIRAANENLTVNNVDNPLLIQGDLATAESAFKKIRFRAPFEFNLVAANIVSDIIIEISPDVKRILKEGGRFVCSGIIIERENDVLEQLKKDGFTIQKVIRKNEWSAIYANA